MQISISSSEYERLKTLYSISKKLSTFKNVDESFADIVSTAAQSFPLLSAVLIEHWEKVPRTEVWFSAGASKATISQALWNAKTNYVFLSGASFAQASELLKDLSNENELIRSDNSQTSAEANVGNYIILPLIIDDLPPLGALQLEGARPLNEKDLEFVNALASLVAVALDRFYKTKKERSFNRQDKEKVSNLEIERDLREDFVSLLTHDLKTPLSVIMGASQLLLKKYEIPETCLKLAEMINHQSQNISQMINNLLDANKIRSGKKLSLKLEKISLNSLVNDTITDLKMIHGERFEVVADHSIEISCDQIGMKRILENLCNNAIKYGSDETPIRIILQENKADIFLKVNNRGSVINPEDQKTIFEQFHRSSEAMLGHHEGWGIGLTLVRGVAESHGGSVEVESTEENGTTFIVRIPKESPLGKN